VTMFTAFGLLSKENAVLTPLLIVVVEVFVFQFQFAPTGQPKGRLTAASFFALFAVPISIGVFYALLHFDSFVGGYRGRGFTLEQRLMTELHVLVLYLKLILAPLPASMSLFHDDFPITQKLDLGIALLAAGFAAAAILAAGLRNRAPWIGFGILWFFACHLLESTFIPLELVFEHRNYLGLLGPTIVVVVLIGAALRAAATRRLAFPVLSALALLLAFNTHARALVWSNMELLLVSDYKQRPTSGRVLSGLATLKFKQGERDQAFQYLHELQALSDVEAAPFLGEIELQCKQPAVDPELFNKAQQRLESGPVTVFASNSLRNLSNRALKDKCLALTADQLGLLLQTAADNSRFGPGVACQIYEMNARFNIEQRQHAAALDHLQRAIRSCGGPGDVRYRKLIEVVLVFAADRGHLSWTLDLLSKAAKTPDKRDITDYFPDWISAEMIRPEKIAQLRAEGQ